MLLVFEKYILIQVSKTGRSLVEPGFELKGFIFCLPTAICCCEVVLFRSFVSLLLWLVYRIFVYLFFRFSYNFKTISSLFAKRLAFHGLIRELEFYGPNPGTAAGFFYKILGVVPVAKAAVPAAGLAAIVYVDHQLVVNGVTKEISVSVHHLFDKARGTETDYNLPNPRSIAQMYFEKPDVAAAAENAAEQSRKIRNLETENAKLSKALAKSQSIPADQLAALNKEAAKIGGGSFKPKP